MLRERARSNGQRDVSEHFDAVRSALEALRKDFYNFAAERGEHEARDGSDLLAAGRQQARNIAGKIEGICDRAHDLGSAAALIAPCLLYASGRRLPPACAVGRECQIHDSR
jgi:hypothetical protein